MPSKTCPKIGLGKPESSGNPQLDQVSTDWDRLYTRATKDWISCYKYCLQPSRRTIMRALLAVFGEGVRLCDARYEFADDGTSLSPTIVLDFGAGEIESMPGGLLPPECDVIRWSSPDVVVRGHRVYGASEALVVCTLATLLSQQRDIRLREETLFYLYGDKVHIDDSWRCRPPLATVWLADTVLHHGWDATVTQLAVAQAELLQRRRGPGRPKDEERDRWMRERFAVIGNVSQVACEAAKRFMITPEAARKGIERSSWYKALRLPVVPTKIEKPRSKVFIQKESPLDAIERVLSRGDATSAEIADTLSWNASVVERLLHTHRGRFQYLPGNRWHLDA